MVKKEKDKDNYDLVSDSKKDTESKAGKYTLRIILLICAFGAGLVVGQAWKDCEPCPMCTYSDSNTLNYTLDFSKFCSTYCASPKNANSPEPVEFKIGITEDSCEFYLYESDSSGILELSVKDCNIYKQMFKDTSVLTDIYSRRENGKSRN